MQLSSSPISASLPLVGPSDRSIWGTGSLVPMPIGWEMGAEERADNEIEKYGADNPTNHAKSSTADEAGDCTPG